jgi:penicillin-binding protein activator
MIRNLILMLLISGLVSCSSFKAERVDDKKSDQKALEITDEWVSGDTERVVEEVLEKMANHKGFKRFLRKHGKVPTVFIGEVQNRTSEAYFPINDINDEFLTEISASGDFTLIDADARDAILKEITYQNDGMVDAKTAKEVGKQTGADLMIFGNIYMKPKTRKGKTIKQYSVNMRMTDIERGLEVLRVRTKLSKYSEQSGSGW